MPVYNEPYTPALEVYLRKEVFASFEEDELFCGAVRHNRLAGLALLLQKLKGEDVLAEERPWINPRLFREANDFAFSGPRLAIEHPLWSSAKLAAHLGNAEALAMILGWVRANLSPSDALDRQLYATLCAAATCVRSARCLELLLEDPAFRRFLRGPPELRSRKAFGSELDSSAPASFAIAFGAEACAELLLRTADEMGTSDRLFPSLGLPVTLTFDFPRCLLERSLEEMKREPDPFRVIEMFSAALEYGRLEVAERLVAEHSELILSSVDNIPHRNLGGGIQAWIPTKDSYLPLLRALLPIATKGEPSSYQLLQRAVASGSAACLDFLLELKREGVWSTANAPGLGLCLDAAVAHDDFPAFEKLMAELRRLPEAEIGEDSPFPKRFPTTVIEACKSLDPRFLALALESFPGVLGSEKRTEFVNAALSHGAADNLRLLAREGLRLDPERHSLPGLAWNHLVRGLSPTPPLFCMRSEELRRASDEAFVEKLRYLSEELGLQGWTEQRFRSGKPGEEGPTVLHAALYEPSLFRIKALLELGADPHALYLVQETTGRRSRLKTNARVFNALSGTSLGAMHLLLSHAPGLSLDLPGEGSALHALADGRTWGPRELRFFLAAGCDVNARNAADSAPIDGLKRLASRCALIQAGARFGESFTQRDGRRALWELREDRGMPSRESLEALAAAWEEPGDSNPTARAGREALFAELLRLGLRLPGEPEASAARAELLYRFVLFDEDLPDSLSPHSMSVKQAEKLAWALRRWPDLADLIEERMRRENHMLVNCLQDVKRSLVR